MKQELLLGDEALGLGAVHSGISGVYGYPGTPSTEIFEFVAANAAEAIRELFAAKGDRIVEVNLRPFQLGAAFCRIYRELGAIGVPLDRVRRFSGKLGAAGLKAESLRIWGDLLCGDEGEKILLSLESHNHAVPAEAELIEELLQGSLGGGDGGRNT